MKQPKKGKQEAGPHLPGRRDMPQAGILVDPKTKRPLIKPGTET